MISAEGVSVGFAPPAAARGDKSAPPQFVLNDITFALARGESVALVGANGSGKTTLLRVLAALLSPERGRVEFDGIDVATDEGRRAARAGIGVLFSNPDLTLIAPTVEREIAFGLENLAWQRPDMLARVDELLAAFDLSARRADSPLALSGGERARLGLAAAIAPRPDFLFIDESLSLLDAEHRADVRGLIADTQRDAEMAVLWATQDFEEARTADRIVILYGGTIAGEVARADVPHSLDLLEDAGLAVSAVARVAAYLRACEIDPGPSLDSIEMARFLDEARVAARPGA
ncbi:MAG: energy-coupling factor ABC transporter ATP-binding protein [bacterium]